MSDRIKGLTVTLRSDMRDDDAEQVINAIRMIKGVISVDSHVADPAHYFAMRQFGREVGVKIRNLLSECDL